MKVRTLAVGLSIDYNVLSMIIVLWISCSMLIRRDETIPFWK